MCLESKAREPKRYLSSRPDKAIDYTVRKYCTYSIGLQQKLCTMLHVMDGGRASPLYRHPVREAVEGYTVNCAYRISRIGLYRVHRVYWVYRIRLQPRPHHPAGLIYREPFLKKLRSEKEPLDLQHGTYLTSCSSCC